MCGNELTPKPVGLTLTDERLRLLAPKVLASPQEPPSPCISVCVISDDTILCSGCWRSLDEIGGWSQSSPRVKREIWQRIEQRLSAHQRLA